MKEHKYDKLLEDANDLHKSTGNNLLVLADDGEDIGAYAAGDLEGIGGMLRSLMEEQRTIAETIVKVAGEYVAGRVADTAASKQALKKAYDKTKKPS